MTEYSHGLLKISIGLPTSYRSTYWSGCKRTRCRLRKGKTMEKVKVGLFSLDVGDSFILSDEQYTITRFQNKRMPSLGKVACCVTRRNRDGKVQMFIRNWDVEKMEVAQLEQEESK